MPRLPPVEKSPDALPFHALARGRVFGGHLRPVALEFLGDQLREARQRALPHLGARDADDDGVVGPDHDPGVDLGRAVGGERGRRTEGQLQAEGEAAADRGGADEELAARDLGRIEGHHGRAPQAFAAAWIAARTSWNVPQRQMLVIAASMSASVGFGFSASSAVAAMIMPAWQ